jgi:hypothetical protein
LVSIVVISNIAVDHIPSIYRSYDQMNQKSSNKSANSCQLFRFGHFQNPSEELNLNLLSLLLLISFISVVQTDIRYLCIIIRSTLSISCTFWMLRVRILTQNCIFPCLFLALCLVRPICTLFVHLLKLNNKLIFQSWMIAHYFFKIITPKINFTLAPTSRMTLNVLVRLIR